MKYIDAEKLKGKIYAEDTVSLAHGSLPEFDLGCHYAFLKVLLFIDSLQQEQDLIVINKKDWEAQEQFRKNKDFGKPLQQEQPSKESLNESQQEFVDIVTERMLKEGPIPTLKGKQKAEFEKEFNRFKQITGMINYPAHMEIYKKIILWFMAWGADNLPNLGKPIDLGKMDIQQEQPSDYLEEAAIDFADNARKQLYSKDYAISSIADYDHGCIDGFKAGAEWMKRKMMEGAANAYILKSYNPVTEQGEPTLHAIEIELVYEDEGKPYLIAGQRARIIILPKEEK